MDLVTAEGNLNLDGIDADDQIITNRLGSDAWALYVERDSYSNTGDLMMTTSAMLVSGHFVVAQNKRVGKAQAKWVVTKADNFEAAVANFKQLLKSNTPGMTNILRGHPMLFQLGGVEIARLENGEAPFARYNMSTAFQKRFGEAVASYTTANERAVALFS